MVFSVIVTLIAFGIMVMLHEAGHFFVAKGFGVTVHEFSIGMGPLALSRKRGETQYSVRWLPLGGYVKLEGEGEESDDPHAFSNISPVKRIAILAAGAAMNVLLGFLCFVIILSHYGQVESTVVQSTPEGSPAMECGILPGDKILKLDNTPVKMRADIDLYMLGAGDNVDVTVERDGQKYTFALSPYDTGSRKILGIIPKTEQLNVLGVLRYSYYDTRYVVKAVFYSLKMLFTGEAGVRDLSGPVGIVKVVDEKAAEAQEQGAAKSDFWLALLNLFAMISVNLGVFNLLPFPALDGGSIIFAFAELVSRRKLKPEIIGYINFAGLVIILGLGVVVMGSDVLHIFGR